MADDNSDHDSKNESGALPTTRRALLAAAGGAAGLGTVLGQSGGDQASLTGGAMSLDEAYNVSGDLWIGPDSAKSQVDATDGRIFMAADTQVQYYGDGGSWVKMGIGSDTEAVPSITTAELSNVYDRVVDTISGLVDALETTTDGERVAVGPGTYSFSSQPTPSANGVEIIGLGTPTFDLTSLSGDPRLDFTSATGWTFEGVKFSDDTGSGNQKTIDCGNDFAFKNITLDGGQGGVKFTKSGLNIDGLTASGLRDTNNGYAAAVVTSGGSNITIEDFDISNCDRALENQDGVTNLTIRDGVVENVDEMALDVHNHTGEPANTDVLFENVTIKNCPVGSEATSKDASAKTEATLRNITHVDVTGRSDYSGEVTVENCTWENPNTTPAGQVIRSTGGRVTLKECRTKTAPSGEPLAMDSFAIAAEKVVVEDCRFECGSQTASVGIQVKESHPETIEIEGLELTGDAQYQGIQANDGTLSSSGWGMIVRDSALRAVNNGVKATDTNNSPVVVAETYRSPGSDTLPTGSVTENVQ